MERHLKILAFSDLHCNVDAAREIVHQSTDVDWVIGAGDFATQRRGIEKTIDVLKAIAKPTILVPGNGESVEELKAACRSWSSVQVLHGDETELDGIPVFGIGAAIPTTSFGAWSYDLSEEQAETMLAKCPHGCVLVSHSPPFGFADVASTGRHLGSSAVRAAVERTAPRLVVCGHIHESWRRREWLGETLIVNAGPQPVFLQLPVK